MVMPPADQKHTGLSLYGSTSIGVIVGVLHYMMTRIAHQFESVFEGFGADLPVLTQFLLPGSLYYWIVPLAVVITLAGHQLGHVSRRVTLLMSSIATVTSMIVSTLGLYLPIFQLGAVVTH